MNRTTMRNVVFYFVAPFTTALVVNIFAASLAGIASSAWKSSASSLLSLVLILLLAILSLIVVALTNSQNWSSRKKIIVSSVIILVIGFVVLSILWPILPLSEIDFFGWINADFFSIVFRNSNFIIPLIIILLPLSTFLRPKKLRLQNWKKLADPWLKYPSFSAIGVAGFGIIAGLPNNIKLDFVMLDMTLSQVSVPTLIKIYLAVIIFIVLANFLRLIGVASSEEEETYHPIFWFAPAFLFAWLGSLGAYTLFLNAIILTFASNL